MKRLVYVLIGALGLMGCRTPTPTRHPPLDQTAAFARLTTSLNLGCGFEEVVLDEGKAEDDGSTVTYRGTACEQPILVRCTTVMDPRYKKSTTSCEVGTADAPLSTLEGQAGEEQDLQALLSGCSLERPETNSLLYGCGEISVFVEEHPFSTNVLQVHLSAARSAFGDELQVEPFSLTAAGQSHKGLRLSFPHPEKKGVRAVEYATEIPVPSGNVRSLRCTVWEDIQRGAPRCQAIVKQLAEGLPSGIVLEVPATKTPLFFGRPLTVPETCRVLYATDDEVSLQCQGADFGWRRLSSPEDASALAGEMEKTLSQEMKKQGPVEKKDGCQIEGETITCKRLTGKFLSKEIVFYVGASTLEGRPFVAFCSFPRKYEGFHPVCNGLFVAP